MNDEFFLNSYSKLIIDRWHNKAQNAFLSAVSAQNWNWLVNPIEEPKGESYYYEEHQGFDGVELLWDGDSYKEDLEAWQEAESRTFKNPIIFIKD